MVIIKNWKKYYTIEESKKITEKYIKKSADELIFELRNKNINKEIKIKKYNLKKIFMYNVIISDKVHDIIHNFINSYKNVFLKTFSDTWIYYENLIRENYINNSIKFQN